MSSTTVRRIVCVTYGDIVREERPLAEDIFPGSLVMINSDNKLQLHNVAGGPALPLILDFNFGLGQTVQDKVTVDNDERGFAWMPRKGEKGYVLLEDGENVSNGDWLQSNGAGAMIKRVVTEESSAANLGGFPLCQALEAVNLTDSSGAENWYSYFCYVIFK